MGAAFTITFVGDTSLGESYLKRGSSRAPSPLWRRLESHPLSFFEGVRPLIADSDLLIGNLETCLGCNRYSPFEVRKRYLGLDEPGRTIAALRALGVHAVSLANNHAMDFGSGVLRETICHLRDASIQPFGAGDSVDEAARPFVWHPSARMCVPAVYLFAACQLGRRYREEYGFDATDIRPGVHRLQGGSLGALIRQTRAADPSGLIVVFPHWGRNYRPVMPRVRELARDLHAAGADLIVGHGAHMLQACQCRADGTTVFSIGNFVFNSPGRYARFNAPPYSFVCRLEVHDGALRPVATLRLYPIVTDNQRTDYRCRPVTFKEFEAVRAILEEWEAQDIDKHAYSLSESFAPSRDQRGLHLRLHAPLSGRFEGRLKALRT